jgi:nitroreductase
VIEKEQIMHAYNYRHACKVFDNKRKIREDDMQLLLETARLTPTSFGMEQHRLLHIKDEQLKAKLQPACWDQKQITTCSDLVAIKAVTDKVKPGTEYVKSMFSRRGLPEDATQAYLQRYEHFLSDKDIECWAQKQCYITLGNMMSAAAMIGIDSCAIEGFETKEVENILNIDMAKERIAVIVAFGFRVNEPGKKYRLDMKDLVEVI